MMPIQEIIVRLSNGDRALLHLVALGDKFRADMLSPYYRPDF
jgi:hypothetical protein